MNSFIQSSIGRKFLMSITGIFLIVFLLVHLTINALLLFGADIFNTAAHFMEVNPIIQVMQPVLAIGFILHIIYATIITIQNQRARPQKYLVVDQSKSSKWASRNMFVLGGLVAIFLTIHLFNFLWKLKFAGGIGTTVINDVEMQNAYEMVTTLFTNPYAVLLYVAGAIFLGFHLHHAFWSAFQTLGLSNNLWRKRLTIIGNIYLFVIAGGFAFIPLFFFLKNIIFNS